MKLSTLIASASAVVLLCTAGVSAALLRQGPAQATEQHKWLLSHVGMWDAKVSGMMGDSTGTWEVKAGPGGMWLFSEFKADMMGMPFHGMEFMGFDPATELFNSVWIDSMSSSATLMSGKYDKATKTLTSQGESVGMDGVKVTMSQVSRYTDADHMSFDMLAPGPDGKDMTVMTIHYTRRK